MFCQVYMHEYVILYWEINRFLELKISLSNMQTIHLFPISVNIKLTSSSWPEGT